MTMMDRGAEHCADAWGTLKSPRKASSLSIYWRPGCLGAWVPGSLRDSPIQCRCQPLLSQSATHLVSPG